MGIILLFVINLVIVIHGSVPVFTTWDALPEKRDNQIYIIVEYGVCLDSNGNGMSCGNDLNYNYISYRNIKEIKEGDYIYTFCIMNPDNNECDDIIVRIDIIEQSWKIYMDIEAVVNYSSNKE